MQCPCGLRPGEAVALRRRDVWKTAREKVLADGDPLRRARRHDLRHAAITAWLNAGVPLEAAQAWSGHETVSVLLDTYLGVMRGDEDLALARFEAALHNLDGASPC